MSDANGANPSSLIVSPLLRHLVTTYFISSLRPLIDFVPSALTRDGILEIFQQKKFYKINFVVIIYNNNDDDFLFKF